MKKPSGLETMTGVRRAGFTLIELLTVIAIIAILAGISAVAVPRYLEKARITQTEANMNNVAQALAAKAAETGNTTGYPPAYGFLLPEARDVDPATLLANPQDYYETRPYTAIIGVHAQENAYESKPWTPFGFDSDGDGALGLLEYSPIGAKNIADNTYSFTTDMYAGPAGEFPGGIAAPTIGSISEPVAQMRPDALRPFVYVPFNSRQLAAMRRYWINGGDMDASDVDITDSDLAGRLFFPPPNYDGFVLVGSSVGGTNGGVVADPPTGNYDPAYVYHFAALRTAFLATLDTDDDGLDFDFRARKNAGTVIMLPDNTNGYGAFIKVVQ